jgi:hypothetical protein
MLARLLVKGREGKIGGNRRDSATLNLNGLKPRGWRKARCCHELFPLLAPSVAGSKASHNTKLPRFAPRYVILSAPPSDPFVTFEGLIVSSLLVRPEGEGAEVILELV